MISPEGFVIVGLFVLAVGGIALAGYIIEDVLKVDDRLARWFERRLR